MEGGENHESLRFCIEVNVPRGGRKLAVLWLHDGATLQSAVVATVDIQYKTVSLNQLIGSVCVCTVGQKSIVSHQLCKFSH